MSKEVKETQPSYPEWLDKDFIQTALRNGERDPNITVLSCDLSMAHAAGDGYGSDMYRVTAKLTDSQQRSVIVKCHPQGGKREEMVTTMGSFDREAKMLTETLPAMYNLLEQASPGKFQPFGAKCLLHGNNPIPFIVLEDLKQSGFKLAERQQGVDLAHTSMALKTLARFHATSLALHQQEPTAIECYDETIYSEKLRSFLAGFSEGAMRILAGEVVNWPGYERYSVKFLKINETFYDRLVEVCKRKDGAFNVLIHGDPWTTNMMFKYDNDAVVDFRLVDFQTAYYSSPALDLQYFLHSCPNEEVQINHIDNLIQEYHSTLTETLNLLGYTKHIILLTDFMNEFSKYGFFGFYASTTVFPVAVSDPNEGMDIEGTISGNAEVTDENKKYYTGTVFINVMKRLLPIYEKMGVF